MLLRSLLLVLALVLPGCSGSDDDATTPAAPAVPAYDERGPAPVGHAIFEATDGARGRKLTLQVWYPAADEARATADAGVPMEELAAEGADREALRALVQAAPGECISQRTRSAPGVAPRAGSFPVVAFSHCHGCTRFSSFTLAEQLASRGIAVVAPDHAGNTLFDELAGSNASLSDATLLLRAGDIRFALDAVLDASNAALPEALRGRFDAGKVGVFGHSFGSMTAGLVLRDDPRPIAGLGIAAPMALLGNVKMAEIQRPSFFLLAREDNSIGELGNGQIRGNFRDAPGASWLAEVNDAGHWSFSDIAGLHKNFKPGCGEAQRQTDKEQGFRYLDNATGRRLAGGYVAAYFALHLQGESAARGYLSGAHPAGVVEVQTRGAQP